MLQLKDSELLRQHAYVGGEWVEHSGGKRLTVTNPADDTPIATVPDLDAAATRDAILKAAAALRAWRDQTAKARADILRRWYDLVLAAREDLALLMTAEQGKPLAEAAGEVHYGASFIEWFAEEGRRAYGDVIPPPATDRRILAIKQPIGVIAAITPWNFPIAMITRKVAPALAAGCTAVIKPAAETPLSALALAQLAQRAGFPPGVFNVVTTDDAAAVGAELCANPLVRKLSFTGSTEIGKLLMQQCAATVKKVSLELGGNAPFIVFDDADLDAAVDGAMASKYRNAGQTCVCANRLLVQDSVYDAFAARLAERVRQLRIGRGEDPGVTIGPLINQAAVDKVVRLVGEAQSRGAQVAVGGAVSEFGPRFFEPTILTEVDPGMAVANEEIFGPVAPLLRFRSEEDAIRMANDTPYGLAAYFYARDIGRIWRVAEGLEYGMVGINEGIISTEVAPFGGIKESGIGREGSKYGIEEYLEIKYLCMGGLEAAR